MDLISIALITAGLLLFSLVSGRLQGTVITAPLVFVVFGFLLEPAGSGLRRLLRIIQPYI